MSQVKGQASVRWGAVVFIAIACLGCGGKSDQPPRASVSGTLLIDGKPVSDVEVHFLNPEFPNHGSFGVTDEDGNFRLVQGAVPGQNTVFFSKINAAGMDMDPESGMDAGQFAAMSTGNEQNPNVKKMEISQLIPPEYSSSNSKLTFSVPDGGTSAAKFEL